MYRFDNLQLNTMLEITLVFCSLSGAGLLLASPLSAGLLSLLSSKCTTLGLPNTMEYSRSEADPQVSSQPTWRVPRFGSSSFTRPELPETSLCGMTDESWHDRL